MRHPVYRTCLARSRWRKAGQRQTCTTFVPKWLQVTPSAQILSPWDLVSQVAWHYKQTSRLVLTRRTCPMTPSQGQQQAMTCQVSLLTSVEAHPQEEARRSRRRRRNLSSRTQSWRTCTTWTTSRSQSPPCQTTGMRRHRRCLRRRTTERLR